MPVFDLPCEVGSFALCDCEWRCRTAAPPLVGADPAHRGHSKAQVCMDACAAAREGACSFCAGVEAEHDGCVGRCAAEREAARAACGEIGHPELGLNGLWHPCVLAAHLAELTCQAGCDEAQAVGESACAAQEAKCRADGCEVEFGSFSQTVERCETLAAAPVGPARLAWARATGDCQAALLHCESIAETIPITDAGRAPALAACQATYAGCAGAANSTHALALAPSRAALLLCVAQAEAAQEARDDRQHLQPARFKRTAGDRNRTLCVAGGLDGKKGTAAFSLAVDHAQAAWLGCMGGCGYGPGDSFFSSPCTEGCESDFVSALTAARLALMESLYACCQPHDSFSECDMACRRAGILHGGEGEEACRAACFHLHGAARRCDGCSEWAASALQDGEALRPFPEHVGS